MNFLNSWLQGIIISVIVATIIEMILPNGNTKKYVKVVLGIYVVFNIITPIINQFTNSNFELSSIINIEEYTKKMETYEVSSNNIDKSNEENIKQIYISNLKNDITAKLEEKEYLVKKIDVKIENDETYKIKNMELSVSKKEVKEEKETKNEVVIDEIEKVEIQVGEKKKEETENNLSSMMTMLGSFTILRLTSLLGAGHVEVTKEQLLNLNEKLNKVECSVKTLA